jgi:hypothetical protein
MRSIGLGPEALPLAGERIATRGLRRPGVDETKQSRKVAWQRLRALAQNGVFKFRWVPLTCQVRAC